MDIETTRRHAEFLALEMLVVSFTKIFLGSSPNGQQVLAQMADRGSALLGQVHPAGTSAEYGDLLMGELQEAWARLMQRVLLPTA